MSSHPFCVDKNRLPSKGDFNDLFLLTPRFFLTYVFRFFSRSLELKKRRNPDGSLGKFISLSLSPGEIFPAQSLIFLLILIRPSLSSATVNTHHPCLRFGVWLIPFSAHFRSENPLLSRKVRLHSVHSCPRARGPFSFPLIHRCLYFLLFCRRIASLLTQVFNFLSVSSARPSAP